MNFDRCMVLKVGCQFVAFPFQDGRSFQPFPRLFRRKCIYILFGLSYPARFGKIVIPPKTRTFWLRFKDELPFKISFSSRSYSPVQVAIWRAKMETKAAFNFTKEMTTARKHSPLGASREIASLFNDTTVATDLSLHMPFIEDRLIENPNHQALEAKFEMSKGQRLGPI